MSAYAMAVHSSLGFGKDDYFFRYKGREFRYVPNWKKNEADSVATILRRDSGKEENDAYRLLAELLSIISYERDCRIILSSGMISHGPHYKLENISGGYAERRTIPISETIDEFYYIPPVRTDAQSNVVRLYREARASNSLYLEILFYWHILCYPNPDNKRAVTYINSYLGHPVYLRESIAQIIQNPIMLKSRAFTSFGTYVEKSVRHSIAHFVRNPKHMETGIDLDNFDQIRHLNEIKFILKEACRYRMKREFQLNEPHDNNVFMYTRTSNARNSSPF